jgi:hypothetical protein
VEDFLPLRFELRLNRGLFGFAPEFPTRRHLGPLRTLDNDRNEAYVCRDLKPDLGRVSRQNLDALP